jgi:hypothetical protein
MSKTQSPIISIDFRSASFARVCSAMTKINTNDAAPFRDHEKAVPTDLRSIPDCDTPSTCRVIQSP